MDPPPSSAVLPIDQDDSVDLCSDELAEILADDQSKRAGSRCEGRGG